MTDICENGGIRAVSDFSFRLPNNNSNRMPTKFPREDTLRDYKSLLEEIITECPYHLNSMELSYYLIRMELVYLYSHDNTTGKYCMAQIGATYNTTTTNFNTELYEKPYSEWEPSQCESSCVAELDTIYRDFINSPSCNDSIKACAIFKTGNPICGKKNFAEIYEKNHGNVITPAVQSKKDLCSGGGEKALNDYKFKVIYDNDHKLDDKGIQDIIDFSQKIMTECPEHSKLIEEEYYKLRLALVYLYSKNSITGKDCKDELGVTSKFNLLDRTFKMESEIYKKPYSEWESSQCESSCVAEIDPIFREFSKSPACDASYDKEESYEIRKTCEIFKNTGNHVCGNIDYAKQYKDSIKNDIKYIKRGEESITSDASTFITSNVILFSFILCILFAFLK